MKQEAPSVSLGQQVSLVTLRTLIGWHFCYEGYVKLLHPAWSRDGQPLPPWSSAGYLKAATGPLARVFHSIAEASWIGAFDVTVALLLILIGTSLLLGLFTQSGCTGALAMLSIFYLSAIPLGAAEAHASIFRTETRAVATDAAARAKFRRYWSFLSPGIILIRWAALRPLRAEAERHAQLSSACCAAASRSNRCHRGPRECL